MRKIILTVFLINTLIITVIAQVGIGTNNPNASSVLELASTSKAFIPPRMNTAQRDMIANPVLGMEIFNLTTTCIEIYRGSSWYNLCSGTSVTPVTTGFLYVPGGYQTPTAWDPPTAAHISVVAAQPKKFDGFINFPSAGVSNAGLYFKYTNAPDFLHITYGTSGAQKLDTAGLASGMSVPAIGYYYVTADTSASVYGWTATKTTWSILGDATPGGWVTDTPLSYDAASQTWKVTCNMLVAGSFKFRANNLWMIDFGVPVGGSAGQLAFVDNPFLGYDATVNNITVPADGNYTLTLDLHTSGNYTYSAIKN